MARRGGGAFTGKGTVIYVLDVNVCACIYRYRYIYIRKRAV